jgi:hypothetical protein
LGRRSCWKSLGEVDPLPTSTAPYICLQEIGVEFLSMSLNLHFSPLMSFSPKNGEAYRVSAFVCVSFAVKKSQRKHLPYSCIFSGFFSPFPLGLPHRTQIGVLRVQIPEFYRISRVSYSGLCTLKVSWEQGWERCPWETLMRCHQIHRFVL